MDVEADTDYKKILENKKSHLKNKLTFLSARYKDKTSLTVGPYIWILFAGNVIYKIEDLLILVEQHKIISRPKLKSGIYTLMRSILEDVIYMRYLTCDLKKDVLQKKFDAYKYYEYKMQRRHLLCLKELNNKKKFIYNTDSSHVLSEVGMDSVIGKHQQDMDILARKYVDDSDFVKICSTPESVLEVCRAYDKAKGISKVEEGSEAKSLEWVYNYLYRFKSLYSHQSISPKEDVLEIIWHRASYSGGNEEIIGLLITVLDTLEETRLEIFEK